MHASIRPSDGPLCPHNRVRRSHGDNCRRIVSCNPHVRVSLFLYYTILYNTILYYTVIYYTLLYSTLLYYVILHYTTLHYTILYDTALTIPEDHDLVVLACDPQRLRHEDTCVTNVTVETVISIYVYTYKLYVYIYIYIYTHICVYIYI